MGTKPQDRGHAKRKGPRPSARARARAFAFEGLPERDRFGIFDPALRGFFVLAVMFAIVFGVAKLFEATGGGPAASVAAVVLVAAVLAGGVLGYRRIWRKPAEREMLLAMAREEDEARAMRSARAKANAQGAAPSAAPDGERAHE